MARFAYSSALFIASLSLLAAGAGAQIRCFTDDNGVFNCGDSFAPEDAQHDRELRNEQGVIIGEEEGEITAEEQAAMDRERLALEEEERLREESRQRDDMLLKIYENAEAIVALRDRRLEVMNSQVRLTEIYLNNLQEKLEGLMRRASRYAPYSEKEDASPIPENLALDIDQTESSIAVREKTLEDIRETQEEIKLEFGRDIERFRELRGVG